MGLWRTCLDVLLAWQLNPALLNRRQTLRMARGSRGLEAQKTDSQDDEGSRGLEAYAMSGPILKHMIADVPRSARFYGLADAYEILGASIRAFPPHRPVLAQFPHPVAANTALAWGASLCTLEQEIVRGRDSESVWRLAFETSEVAKQALHVYWQALDCRISDP